MRPTEFGHSRADHANDRDDYHGSARHTPQGEPIVYTVTGTLSGTLTDSAGDSTAFTNATFCWKLIGNAASLASLLGLAPGPVFEVPARTDIIRIGDHVLTPTIPTVFAAASVPAPVPFGIAGFSDVKTQEGLAWQSPALAGYDGVSALAPLSVTFDHAGPLPTNAGTLSITTASDLHFSAMLY
jgi:hypothetical protein